MNQSQADRVAQYLNRIDCLEAEALPNSSLLKDWHVAATVRPGFCVKEEVILAETRKLLYGRETFTRLDSHSLVVVDDINHLN